MFILILLLGGCMGSKKILPRGLKYLSIGDPMPEAGTRRLKGRAVRDTLFNEGGYQWRAAVLQYKGGKVYIEEDFWGKGKVNRIRIESPELKFKREFSVGMDVEALKRLTNDWNIIYLEDYGLLDLASPLFPEVHFLVKENGRQFSATQFEEIALEQLSDTSKIVAIVVM
ncbi:MAG: hypothetical protein D6730_23200 [Bacteroidetes bacterium]|nr:MAG: hypothetical protein D6730_23200 [Bacteroidota bacterium]